MPNQKRSLAAASKRHLHTGTVSDLTKAVGASGAEAETVPGSVPTSKIERVALGRLKPNPRNARTHSAVQVRQIAGSIERFGFTNPILIDDEGMILAGHGRLAAAKLLEMDEVPVLRLSHISQAERRAYVLADNKLALNAGWDRDQLAVELQGLIDLDFEVELTGFSVAEIDFALVAAATVCLIPLAARAQRSSQQRLVGAPSICSNSIRSTATPPSCAGSSSLGKRQFSCPSAQVITARRSQMRLRQPRSCHRVLARPSRPWLSKPTPTWR